MCVVAPSPSGFGPRTPLKEELHPRNGPSISKFPRRSAYRTPEPLSLANQSSCRLADINMAKHGLTQVREPPSAYPTASFDVGL